MASVTTSRSHWLSDCLCDLMASPHVPLPPHGGMHLGPGPIDLFSTRFNEYFTKEAHGTICGHVVDREGIKQCLLALQKKWNPEDVKIIPEARESGIPLQHNMLSTEVEWTPPGDNNVEVISAQASVTEGGKQERIRFLKMEGNAAMFRP